MDSCEGKQEVCASVLILANISMQRISSCVMCCLAWVLPRVPPGIRTSLSSLSSRTIRSMTGVGRSINGAGVVVGAGTDEGSAAGADTGASEGAGSSAGAVVGEGSIVDVKDATAGGE